MMMQVLLMIGTAVAIYAFMAFVVSVIARCGDWRDYTLRREPDTAGAFWPIAIPIMIGEMLKWQLGNSLYEMWRKAADYTARKLCH